MTVLVPGTRRQSYLSSSTHVGGSIDLSDVDRSGQRRDPHPATLDETFQDELPQATGGGDRDLTDRAVTRTARPSSRTAGRNGIVPIMLVFARRYVAAGVTAGALKD